MGNVIRSQSEALLSRRKGCEVFDGTDAEPQNSDNDREGGNTATRRRGGVGRPRSSRVRARAGAESAAVGGALLLDPVEQAGHRVLELRDAVRSHLTYRCPRICVERVIELLHLGCVAWNSRSFPVFCSWLSSPRVEEVT